MLLQLDFSPKPDDDFQKLVNLWTYAFTRSIGRVNEQLDAHRINDAFGRATYAIEKFPAPKTIIDLMQRRPEVERINYDPREHEQQERGTDKSLSEMLDDILENQKGENHDT